MSTPNWDRLWRTAGIQFVVFFVICCVIYGHLPGVSASADELGGFYTGDRTRVLIAVALLGLVPAATRPVRCPEACSRERRSCANATAPGSPSPPEP